MCECDRLESRLPCCHWPTRSKARLSDVIRIKIEVTRTNQTARSQITGRTILTPAGWTNVVGPKENPTEIKNGSGHRESFVFFSGMCVCIYFIYMSVCLYKGGLAKALAVALLITQARMNPGWKQPRENRDHANYSKIFSGHLPPLHGPCFHTVWSLSFTLSGSLTLLSFQVCILYSENLVNSAILIPEKVWNESQHVLAGMNETGESVRERVNTIKLFEQKLHVRISRIPSYCLWQLQEHQLLKIRNCLQRCGRRLKLQRVSTRCWNHCFFSIRLNQFTDLGGRGGGTQVCKTREIVPRVCSHCLCLPSHFLHVHRIFYDFSSTFTIYFTIFIA